MSRIRTLVLTAKDTWEGWRNTREKERAIGEKCRIKRGGSVAGKVRKVMGGKRKDCAKGREGEGGGLESPFVLLEKYWN
jgi:hypothetical protein